MNLNSGWRTWFGDRDLARGESYYRGGMVGKLEQTSAGWRAQVAGGKFYATFVPADTASNALMTCTCPRFEDGFPCKHLAATCYAIEAQLGSSAPSEPTATSSIEELAQSIPESDARAFLIEVLHGDAILAARFTQRFGRIDVKAASQGLKAQVSELKRVHGHRGFIEWRESMAFESEFHAAVNAAIDPLIERGEIRAAFELTLETLKILQGISIDDSNGFFTDSLCAVIDCWEALIEEASKRADNSFAPAFFDDVIAFLGKPPKGEAKRDIFDYEKERAEKFLVERFADSPELSDRMADFASDRIKIHVREYDNAQAAYRKAAEERKTTARGKAQHPRTANDTARMASFSMQRAYRDVAEWTLVKLRALRAGGASYEDLKSIAGELVVESGICKFLVDLALSREDEDEALTLLRNCKQHYIGTENGTYPKWVAAKLVDLTFGRDVAAARVELLYLVEHTARYESSEESKTAWRRLKATYGAREWAVQRESFLSAMHNGYARRDCLAEEGLYDRLMDDIEHEAYGSLGACRPHQKELVKRFPERVLQLHLDSIAGDSRYPGNDRRGYREFTKRLREVQKLPGGPEAVATIVEETRSAYPRRPALLEELDKL